MEFKFAKRAQNAVPSLIREVGQRGATIPNFISFALGNPCSEAIPTSLIKEAANHVLTDNPLPLLQYGNAQGNPDFREFISKKLIEDYHFKAEDNDILIVSGSQQGLDLLPRVMCDEGEGVFVEEFVFTGALNSIRNTNGVPIAVKMDEYGMIPSDLEAKIKQFPGKYIYLIPNFQNPTGITMPLARRQEIYAIASKYDLLIYEDNPYGNLRYQGDDVPSFKSFDHEDRVIYAGSFSKILSAGLRVGFLYGPKELIQKVQSLKSSNDSQSPMLNQAIVKYVFEHVDYDEYLKNLCGIYNAKYLAMKEGLETHVAKYCKVSIPDGGMFFWITLPDTYNVDEVYERCLSKGLGIVRSLAFAADLNNPGHSFRLNFSYPSVEEIKKGTFILGEVLSELAN